MAQSEACRQYASQVVPKVQMHLRALEGLPGHGRGLTAQAQNSATNCRHRRIERWRSRYLSECGIRPLHHPLDRLLDDPVRWGRADDCLHEKFSLLEGDVRGSVGVSGSEIASNTTGRSLVAARSHVIGELARASHANSQQADRVGEARVREIRSS